MQANSKITISKRVIAVLLVALLALSAFNTYMIFSDPAVLVIPVLSVTILLFPKTVIIIN